MGKRALEGLLDPGGGLGEEPPRTGEREAAPGPPQHSPRLSRDRSRPIRNQGRVAKRQEEGKEQDGARLDPTGEGAGSHSLPLFHRRPGAWSGSHW